MITPHSVPKLPFISWAISMELHVPLSLFYFLNDFNGTTAKFIFSLFLERFQWNYNGTTAKFISRAIPMKLPFVSFFESSLT
jgi:hypothetical protein